MSIGRAAGTPDHTARPARLRNTGGLRREQGFATLEMALVTPFLVVLLLVTAEFSRAFYEYNTLTKSVRHAARYAAINAIDGTGRIQLDDFVQATKNLAVSGSTSGGAALLPGLSINDIDVLIVNPSGVPQQAHIQVSGVYQFLPLAPAISSLGFLSNDIDTQFQLIAESTMRAQR